MKKYARGGFLLGASTRKIHISDVGAERVIPKYEHPLVALMKEICEAWSFTCYAISVAKTLSQKQIEFKVPQECKEIAKVSAYHEMDVWRLAERLDHDYDKVRKIIFIAQELNINAFVLIEKVQGYETRI